MTLAEIQHDKGAANILASLEAAHDRRPLSHGSRSSLGSRSSMSLPIAIPNSISRDDGDDESIGSSFSLLEIQNLKSSARSAQEDMTARAEASRSEAGRSQDSPEKLRAPAYLPWWEVAHRSLSPERRLPFWAGQRDADEKRLPQVPRTARMRSTGSSPGFSPGTPGTLTGISYDAPDGGDSTSSSDCELDLFELEQAACKRAPEDPWASLVRIS